MSNWLDPSAILPPADTYLGAVLHVLWDYSPHVLLAGLLFSLTGIPAFSLFLLGAFLPALLLAAVTLVPAWVALLATVLALFESQPLAFRRVIPYMAMSWYRHWRTGLLTGIAGTFPIATFLTTLPLLDVPGAPDFIWIGLIADVWLLAALVALSFYAIPLRINTEMNWPSSIRAAAVLASRNIGHTTGVIGLGIVIALAMAFLSSGLWFVLPSVLAIFIASNYKFATNQDRL